MLILQQLKVHYKFHVQLYPYVKEHLISTNSSVHGEIDIFMIVTKQDCVSLCIFIILVTKTTSCHLVKVLNDNSVSLITMDTDVILYNGQFN